MYLVQIYKLCVFTCSLLDQIHSIWMQSTWYNHFFHFWNIWLRSQTATLTPFGNTVPGGGGVVITGQNLLPDWDKVIWSAKIWVGVRPCPPVPPALFCRLLLLEGKLLLCWPGIHIKNWAGVIKLGAETCIPHYLLHCKYISSLILHCPNYSFSLCANSHLLPNFFGIQFVFKSSGSTMYSTD